MRFSVVTWNILAQAYIKPGRYDHVPPESLQPERRRALLLSQIAALDADVYCLQEVEPDAFEAVASALGEGYGGFFEQKRARPDGCAILWRRRAMTPIRTEALHFEAIEPGYDHVAAVALLQQGERRLAVASTHLRWQPEGTPTDRHLGCLQLGELLALRSRLATEPEPPDAWIVAGDLNALSDGPVIREALRQGLDLSCRSQRPWDTVNIGGRRRKLDYLLIEPERLAPEPGPLPRLERDTPMPSAQHPSDHLPLRVAYTWR